ncbi:MAG: hypothetical protein QNJ42_14780 [Crocosphaera sp.]|nr:hypothetical protein [Crocosphaera sp.]
MVWQLLQVRQLESIPLIMVGPMWKDLVVWANKYMIQEKTPLADSKDIEIPYCVNTVPEVINIIEKAQQQWLMMN